MIRYTAQQSPTNRLRGLAVAGALFAGLGSRLPPVRATKPSSDRESIDDFLTGVFGTKVITSLALTAERANRKPVLQVFDARGHTIAFVKIGVDPLTRELVDAEAATLQHLGTHSLSHTRVPEVIFHGAWKGAAVLVTAAMSLGPRPRRASTALDLAMHEIASSGPGSSDIEHDYIVPTLASVHQLPDTSTTTRLDTWLGLFEQVTALAKTAGIKTGAWHGDWTEWNCAVHSGQVAVWDWERYEIGVPDGFDRLHYVMNILIGPKRDRFREAAAKVISDPLPLLLGWRLSREQARITAMLYILQLSLRYLRDGAPTGSLYGRIEEWAYPAVRSGLDAMTRGIS